jgi:hypothetical protein
MSTAALRIVFRHRRRILARDLAEGLFFGLGLAAVGVLGWVALRSTIPVPALPPRVGPVALAAIAVMTPLVYSRSQRRLPTLLAQEIDSLNGLHDLLSSALEFAEDADPWRQRCVSEAARVCRERALVMPTPSRRWHGALYGATFMMIVAALWLVAHQPLPKRLVADGNRAVEHNAGVRSAALAVASAAASLDGQPLPELERVTRELSDGSSIKKEQALAETLQARRALEAQKGQDLLPHSLLDQLREQGGASAELAHAIENADAARVSRALTALATELKNGELTAEQSQAVAALLQAMSRMAVADDKRRDWSDAAEALLDQRTGDGVAALTRAAATSASMQGELARAHAVTEVDKRLEALVAALSGTADARLADRSRVSGDTAATAEDAKAAGTQDRGSVAAPMTVQHRAPSLKPAIDVQVPGSWDGTPAREWFADTSARGASPAIPGARLVEQRRGKSVSDSEYVPEELRPVVAAYFEVIRTRGASAWKWISK